jgi:hypothetical protein
MQPTRPGMSLTDARRRLISVFQSLIDTLPWVVGLLCLFFYLAISSWSKERRLEREALYRSEAIKKLAEMQGNPTEPVLNLLRESLASLKTETNPSPANMGPLQAREYYRSQTLQRIANAPGGGGEAALRFLQEEQRLSARRSRDGLRIGGVICVSVGIALVIFLRAVLPLEPPVYLAGLIPAVVGAILFSSSFVIGSRE